MTDNQGIKSEETILMTIASKARVDFKDLFGTVTSVADQEFDITCQVSNTHIKGARSLYIEESR